MPQKTQTIKLIVTITTTGKTPPQFRLLTILNGAVNTNDIEDFDIDFYKEQK